ncbi:MAG: T9SS type A sorting domain-containing protein [Bacteroidota bacterium]
MKNPTPVRAAAALTLFLTACMLALPPLPSPHTVPDLKLQRKLHDREAQQARTGYPSEALAWYFRQRAVPAESIPPDWQERALDHISRHNTPAAARKAAAVSWVELGPKNIGGRVRSLAVHPSNPSVMYAGSVSGGVFHTSTGGASWLPADDFKMNLVIGSIVLDPSNPLVIYAATGEGFFNIDALRGAGVLKSTDGGSTWTLLTAFSGGPAGFPYYINSLYIRPDSTGILYAATNSGLFRTLNGGISWTFLHQGTSSVRATQIAPHPSAPRTFYVSYGNFSTDGIYRTTNGGASFTKLTAGLPSTGYHRISLAVAPSSGSTLYASYAAPNGSAYGMYRSTDGGNNWSTLAVPSDPVGGGTHLGTLGWYANVLAVDPQNPLVVYAGGINLFKSVNGGSSWSMISNWYAGAGYPYVHADQHALLFSGTTLFIGNDGGVFRTTNGGSSYTELTAGLATVQFYGGAVHPTADILYGGTQDNGTLRSATIPSWTIALGGDGGHAAVDFNNPTTVYTEYVYLCFQKSLNSGSSWTRAMNGIPTSGSNQFDGTSDRCEFIAPFAMDPSNPQRIGAGTYRVFLTTNGGSLWTAASTDLTGSGPGGVGTAGSTISAVSIAKTNPAVLYVGTSGIGVASRIQVTTNSGSVWSNVTALPLPSRYVTRILIDPAGADRAWALYSGFNTSTPSTPGHVFLTTNRGVTWTDRSGNLPDVPANAGVVDPANPSHILVGTDLGVFETLDGGQTWTRQVTGMANVAVADMDLRSSDNVVFAATHGRGMFKSSGPLTGAPPEAHIPSEMRLLRNYPNPFNASTTIRFRLPAGADVTLEVLDLTGRRVALLVRDYLPAGEHSARFEAGALASGPYICRLTSAEGRASGKMLLLR